MIFFFLILLALLQHYFSFLLVAAAKAEVNHNVLTSAERERAAYQARTLICSFHKHSTSWTDSDFDKFIGNLELSSGCVSALDRHQMEWANTNQDKKSVFRYLNSVGGHGAGEKGNESHFQIWSKCTQTDAALWETAIDQVLNLTLTSSTVSFDSLESGCGAEDHTLDVLRRIDPHTFNNFIASVSLSPHIALGFLRWSRGDRFDKFVYGEDEADEKTPYSILKNLLVPGYISSIYFKEFRDSNPYESIILMIISLASDLAFIIDVFLCLRHGEWKYAVKDFINRNILAFFAILFIRFFNRLILEWWIFSLDKYSYLLEVFLFVKVFIALNKLITRLLKMEYANKSNRIVVDPIMELNMLKEIKKIKNTELFDSTDWTQAFERGARLGSGSFATVYLGRDKRTQKRVALKFFDVATSTKSKSSKKGEISETMKLFEVIVTAIVLQNQDKLDHAYDLAMQLFNKLDNDNMSVIKHETIVLKAIASLNHKSLVKFGGAFKCGDQFLVAMSFVYHIVGDGDGWNKNLTLFSEQPSEGVMKRKLSIVQTMFSAMSALHSCNICHRDLKPANLGVRLDDPECAVILDMGTWHLPGQFNFAEKIARELGTSTYMSPESYKYLMSETESGENGKDIEKLISQNYKGPPMDVWSAAISAIQILVVSEKYPNYCYKGEINKGIYAFPENLFVSFEGKLLTWSTLDTETLVGVLVDHHLDSSLVELFRGMLHPDRGKRTTMKEAANHVYFRDNQIGDFDPRKRCSEENSEASPSSSPQHATIDTEELPQDRHTPGSTPTSLVCGDNPNPSPKPPRTEVIESIISTSSSSNSTSNAPDRVSSSLDDLQEQIEEEQNGNNISLHLNHRVIALQNLVESEARKKPKSPPPPKFTDKLYMKYNLVSGILAYFKNDDAVDKKEEGSRTELSLPQWEELYDKIKIKGLFPALDKQQLFELLDFNESGTLSKFDVLAGVFLILRHVAEADETRKNLLFNAFDVDSNGQMPKNKFVEMMMFSHHSGDGGDGGGGGGNVEKYSRSALIDVFNQKVNGADFITFEQLKESNGEFSLI